MIIKDKLRFEWDHNKDRTNQKKHFVSFKDALTVFRDEEERFILIGISTGGQRKKQYFQRKRNAQ